MIEYEVDTGWIHVSSKAIALGEHIKLRCSINGISGTLLLCKRKEAKSVQEVLSSSNQSGMPLLWGVNHAKFGDSGLYECVSGSFSDVMIIHVYKLTNLQRVVIPTFSIVDTVAGMQLSRRLIDSKGFEDHNSLWLSCCLVVGNSHFLDLITVRWGGGLFESSTNHTELSTVYSQNVTRNVSENSITTRLRLNIPVMDPRVYGPYRCEFTFHKSEEVVGTVDLKIAPIIRLAYDPPPIPPANFSHRFICKDPPCTANLDNNNVSDLTVATWMGACELVAAYPPVSDSGVIWAWSEPQWASYAIHRVNEVGKATYLSEMSSWEATADKDLGIPWQVLEQRKRRKRHAKTVEELHVETGSDRPSAPVIFWCWTRNSVGQTAIWWPGPVLSTSGFWASIWWPILGVALELISLCIVFGFFRYCYRKRQLRAYVQAPGGEQVSFGLSRLLDTEESHSNVRQQSTDVGLASEIKRTGLSQSIPYVRLSEGAPHSDAMDEKLGCIGPGLTEHNGNRSSLSVDPVERDLSVPITPVQEADEYFWDLDGAQANRDQK